MAPPPRCGKSTGSYGMQLSEANHGGQSQPSNPGYNLCAYLYICCLFISAMIQSLTFPRWCQLIVIQTSSTRWTNPRCAAHCASPRLLRDPGTKDETVLPIPDLHIYCPKHSTRNYRVPPSISNFLPMTPCAAWSCSDARLRVPVSAMTVQCQQRASVTKQHKRYTAGLKPHGLAQHAKHA